MGVNPFDDLFERRTWREDGTDAFGQERFDIALGDDAATKQNDIIGAPCKKCIEDRGKQSVVCA